MAYIDTGGKADGPDTWSVTVIGVVALCFAINMADGIDVTILSYIAPRLQTEWHIGPAVMGQLFSASLIGMAIGGMLIAPLADHFGRRKCILLALALMSVGMIASARADSPAQLFVLRIIVGSGIGTVLAAMAALAAESAPRAHRDLAVGIVQAGYPFAAAFTGLVVAGLLPVYGWRAIMLGAGLVTVVLLPAALLALPRDAAGALSPRGAAKVANLFGTTFGTTTIALWIAVFFGLMVLYFIVSWVPRLSIDAGLSETNGIYAGAIYSLGAFAGTVGMSFLALRVPLGRLIPAMLISAAVAMLGFGSLHLSAAQTLLVAFVIGVLLQGGYNGLWPLAARAYPAEMRATGIGWAMGIGRGGAIVGPTLGGYLMGAHVRLPLLFATFCVPLLVCAGCAFTVACFSARSAKADMDTNSFEPLVAAEGNTTSVNQTRAGNKQQAE